jgi:hypothetical protein
LRTRFEVVTEALVGRFEDLGDAWLGLRAWSLRCITNCSSMPSSLRISKIGTNGRPWHEMTYWRALAPDVLPTPLVGVHGHEDAQEVPRGTRGAVVGAPVVTARLAVLGLGEAVHERLTGRDGDVVR